RRWLRSRHPAPDRPEGRRLHRPLPDRGWPGALEVAARTPPRHDATMPPIRTAAAVSAGKAASLASRVLRRGGGTALPGLVAERVDPRLVRNLGRSLGRGRVLITGTNGKTTTSRIVARALGEADIPFVHNREGSNHMRGIASTLLDHANAPGSLPP